MWVRLPDSSSPPYHLGHLFDSYDFTQRVRHCSDKTPGWRYGWIDGDLGPQLKNASELCTAMRGTNVLMIGDSLTQQMYQSFRARLRSERYAHGRTNCAGNMGCESSAPALCGGYCAVPYDNNNQHSAHMSVCDNGATLFQAQAFRWVLDVASFFPSDVRHRRCGQRVRQEPYSFGLVVIPTSHLRHMLEVAKQPSVSRFGRRHHVHRLNVVVNQMAHIHGFVDKLARCYYATPSTKETSTQQQEHKTNTAASPWQVAMGAATRDALRFWASDQARWATALRQIQRNLTAADGQPPLQTRIFYRSSPGSCDAFCKPPHGAPRTPLDAATLAHGVLTEGEYTHQHVYWINDMARSAFSSQGHGIVDLEAMMGARVDAYPATYNGSGDKLHFCQPGPADWGLDSMLWKTLQPRRREHS